MTDTLVLSQVTGNVAQERRVRLLASQWIYRHEGLVPTAIPTQRRGSTLHVGIALSELSVVIGGDSTLQVAAESLWREQLDLFQRLGSNTTHGGQGIARLQHYITRYAGSVVTEDDVGNRTCANIARWPVADTIGGREGGTNLRRMAQFPISKAQVRI